jgi:hypothetical protein
LGEYPISVGTSLALEGFFRKEPNNRQERIRTAITKLWVNLETVVRNAIEAYPSDNLKTLPLNDVVDSVFEDVEAIQTTIRDQSEGSVALVLYYEDPEERKWLFPHAQWRVPTTERKKRISLLHDLATRQVSGMMLEKKMPLNIIKRRPPVSHDHVAILTHHIHNLFWERSFGYLVLLESYTGALKDANLWSGKMKGVDVRDQMPFNPLTLQILGDGSLFAGESRVIQRELKVLARNANWTKVTTRERILNDISRQGTPVLKEAYNKLMSRH